MKKIYILTSIILFLVVTGCTKSESKDNLSIPEETSTEIEIISDSIPLELLFETNVITNINHNIQLWGADEVVTEIKVSGQEYDQELTVSNNIGLINENYGLNIADFNFDGYSDISIQQVGGAGANTLFEYWLWDNSDKRFEFNDDLSELTAVTFYYDDKLVVSENQCCAGSSYIEVVYEFEGDSLIKIKQLNREWNEEKENFTYSFYIISNGVWKLVYEEESSNPFSDKWDGYEHLAKGKIWGLSDFKK